MSTLTTIEYVWLEIMPFVKGLDGDEVSAEHTALPEPFLTALKRIITDVDSSNCVTCDDAIGFVLTENADGFECPEWRITTLAREDGGPVVLLCESCTPVGLTVPE